MVMTFDELKSRLDAEGLRYFVDPVRTAALLAVQGLFGTYQIVVHLADEGHFLQFRTINYLRCPADSSHAPIVHRVLAQVNYNLRLIKYGWDAADGEIAVYADVWLEDSTLTQAQFHRMIGGFMTCLDMSHPRVYEAVQSGRDIGAADPQELLKGAPGSGSIADKLRDLLDSIRKKGGGPAPKPPDAEPPDAL
jgi:hypothetical protein